VRFSLTSSWLVAKSEQLGNAAQGFQRENRKHRSISECFHFAPTKGSRVIIQANLVRPNHLCGQNFDHDYFRTRAALISAAFPTHSSKPSSASKRSNQCECPAFDPHSHLDTFGRTFQLLHRCASTASRHIPWSPCLPRRFAVPLGMAIPVAAATATA